MTGEPTDTGGTIWDDPNRQVVGVDPAWVEGTGGGAEPKKTRAASSGGPVDLDDMTKEELLEHATELGVTPANKNMTKEELRAGIDAAESGGAK